MNHERFGHNLAKLLDALDLTQHELAKRAGLTPAAVSQILNGQRDPALKTVCKILMVIPVKFEALVK